MNYRTQLQEKLDALNAQKDLSTKELEKLEEDFANVKLNPYGITAIDFSKRQELSSDLLKMEGSIMGLSLAIELYDEANKSS